MAQFRLSFEYQMAKRRSMKRSGFTLVEIAVALAIFVIGALAIIQIFPPALNVVRGSERRTAATYMSRARVTAFEDRKQVAPDAIYSVTNPATDTWEDPRSTITNAALLQTGGISRATLPSGPADLNLTFTDSNPRNIAQTTLGRFKHIQGERHKVRYASVISGGTPVDAPYVLTQFPYQGNVAVYGEENLSGVRIDANGYLDFTDAKNSQGRSVSGTAPLPGGVASVANRPRDDLRDDGTANPRRCVFYVTYRWLGANGRIQGVVDEPLLIPPDTPTTGWTPAPIINNKVIQGGSAVIPGLVTVRVRKLLAVAVPNNGRSYPAPGMTYNTDYSEAAVGFVRLDNQVNVNGVFSSLRNFDGGSTFTTVSLDYDVADWRNIVHDETVSNLRDSTSATTWNVSMPMQNLNPEVQLLTFIQRPPPVPSNPYPYPRLHQASWMVDRVPVSTSVGGSQIVDANLSAGRITFDIPPAVPTDPPPIGRTRTVLNTTAGAVGTLDEWGHQMTIAASSYVPFPNITSPQHPREGWREYAWTPGTSVVYFQAAEAGKLVMVDYEYPDTSAPGGYRQVQGAIFPISLDVDGAFFTPPAGFAPTTSQAAAIKLTTLNGTLLAPASAITAVRGVSIAARTAWLENGRYQQVVTKGYRPLVSAL